MSTRSLLTSLLSSTSRPLTRGSPISFRPLFATTRPAPGLLPLSSRRPYAQVHLAGTSTSTPKPSQNSSSSSSSSSSSPPPSDNPDDPSPSSQSLGARFKALSKKYGWWAVGMYSALGLLDFGVAFVGVSWFGTERVGLLERKVVGWGYEQLGWERDEPAIESEGKHGGGLWTQVVVAYTIHKTLFLPVRLALLGAVLPKFVAYMTRLGWAGGGAKGVQAKVKQVVKDRAS